MSVLHAVIFGLFAIPIGFLGNFWMSRRRLYELAAKLPGPKGLPFIGLGYKFFNVNYKEMFGILSNLTQGYSSPAATWLGPELVVTVDTPEALKIVLNSDKCLNKSPLYDALLLTKGLVLSGGEMWKRHRKILNPTFSIGILQKMVPTFYEKSNILVDNMKTKIDEEQFNVYDYISPCSLESLLKVSMDYDHDYQSKPLDNEYIHHVEL